MMIRTKDILKSRMVDRNSERTVRSDG
jgi:hypothetical protein